MIESGTLIDGRYEVLERVGSGGMADVYLASDRLLGRRVAVKVLQHRFAEDEEFVERFKREASSAAGLSHPNVVSIFDRGEWDGTFYIAMEYLPGRTLKELLRERGPLPPATAIDVALQVLRAARFAHRRGVIHRDLKPHNVILDEEGRAKVTDFGIARAGASDMTLTGSIMGTAQYLSPEQAQGQPVTEASDLYAIGVMLYELLAGGVPFDGETAVAIALQHISRQPPAPSAVNAAVPPQLDAVVLRMLAKDPAGRFADTSEAISALEQVRASLPEPMTEPVLSAASRGIVTVEEPGGQATGELGNVALAAAGAGVLAAYGVPPPPAAGEPPQAREDEPSRRRRAALLIGSLLLLAAIVAALILLLAPAGRHTVPGVVKKTQARATAILKHAGFRVVTESATSEHKRAGTVVNQTPPAGTEARRGSEVTIVVSSGPGFATVPPVRGLPEARAIESIHGVALEPHVSRRPSESIGAGAAIGTKPKAGTRLRRGENVIVVISTGPPKVTVPHVRGDTLEEAEAAIEEAGLAVGKVRSRREPGIAAETVLSQFPGAGSLREPSTPVNLVVAKAAPKKGHGKVSVPDVLEQTVQEAEATLAAEGLTANVAHRPTSEPEEVGYVIEQSPGPGSRLDSGGVVTVYVGKAAATSTTETKTTETTSTDTTTTSTDTTSTEAPLG